MSEFLNDPYHRSAPVEHSAAVEHLTNAGAILVDSFLVVAEGIAKVARGILHHQQR